MLKRWQRHRPAWGTPEMKHSKNKDKRSPQRSGYPGPASGCPACYANGNLTKAQPERSALSELHRITVDPQQSGGRPCLRNLRIRVKDVWKRPPRFEPLIAKSRSPLSKMSVN